MSDCRRGGVSYKRHKIEGNRCVRCMGWVVANHAESLKAAIEKAFKDTNAAKDN